MGFCGGYWFDFELGFAMVVGGWLDFGLWWWMVRSGLGFLMVGGGLGFLMVGGGFDFLMVVVAAWLVVGFSDGVVVAWIF